MSGLDIEAIRRRSELVATVEIEISRGRMSDDAPFGAQKVDITPSGARALHASAADVPVLLAEIGELRYVVADGVERIAGLLKERDEARAALADALQVIADLRGETT